MLFAVLLLLSGAVVSCGLFVSFGRYDTSQTSQNEAVLRAVSGTIDGLGNGVQVKVLLNGATSTVAADGQFAFPPVLADGEAYVVSAENPAGHDCSVAGSMGTIAGG